MMAPVRRSASIVFMVCCFVMFLSDHVYAYIDPASGSYIFQMLVASLLGALYAGKVYWQSIKSFATRLFTKKPKKSLDE